MTRDLPTARTLRVRALAWRLRVPVAAACAGLAVALAVGRLSPAPPATTMVAVAAHDLRSGTALTRSDIVVRAVPVTLVPEYLRGGEDETSGPQGAAAADGFVGERLAVPVPSGLPLVDGLLADPASEAPPGTVIVPVRFADAEIAALLAPGTRVDVIAAALLDGAAPQRIAQDATVLAPSAGSAGSGTGGTEDDAAGSTEAESGSADGGTAGPVLLAVRPDEAVLLSGAAASSVLGAIIVG